MEIRSRAPGKVILCGEHAVVHGSTAIAGSIDLCTHVRLTLLPPASGSGDEDKLEIDLKDMDMKFSWPCIKLKQILGEYFADIHIFEPKPCSSEQLDLISKLISEKNIPESKIQICSGISAFLFLYTCIHGFKPAKAIITSELPLGSGLGSSAAFCVSLSGALMALNEKIVINNEIKDWVSFKNKDLELVNSWAFEGEKIIHGKPSGIDNTVSAFGNMIKFKKGEITKLNSTTPIKMLVTDTKTPRNTKHLVSKVSLKTSKLPLTMQSIFNAIDSLSHELATIVESPAGDAGLAGDEVAVCEREARLKEVFEMNMGLLRCIGVSHECIERVIRVTNNESLVSKLTGAGGGGCVLTLIPTLYMLTDKEPHAAEVWEGERVIKYGRKLIGATDPQKSEPGTIRGDLAVVVGRNIIHGSDGPETAKAVIGLWFNPAEVVSYTSNAEKWIYGLN